MSRFIRVTTLWLWGGFAYYLIELAWRGSSHPSMFVIGGLCFLLLGGMNNYLPWEMGIITQGIIGAVFVTLVELAAGAILNLWLGIGIWDYSALPFNLLGQICLPFSAAWVAVSIVAVMLDDWLRHLLFKEEMPHYVIF